ncbi:MAG TPA: type II secretion system protein [Tepidisphaeraceae bacterium]|nr:type II secretion system protein [Tepidisphaeraceae bacterium]
MRVNPSRLRRVVQRHRGKGFTLVELLVVIGIIAVLIGILLPTLQGARRSANSVKCLAALKEIGNCFSLYANDNKGVYPPSRDTVIKSPTGAALDRRWTDYLAKYMSKKGKDFTGSQDVNKIRANSVLWGCPEWARTIDFDSSLPGYKDVYTGYGMNFSPGYPDQHKDANNAHRSNAARKGYIKQSFYGRRGSERLLIADSTYDYISLPPSGYTANVKFAPFDVLDPVSPTTDFFVDSRHMKPGTQKQAAKRMQTINALFADGHAGSLSLKQAYNAVRMPGGDYVPNVPF